MTKRNGIRRLAAAALLFGVVGSTTACDLDKLLDVTDRDRVTEGTLLDPDVIDVVVAGALGDFTSAYAGGESYLTVSALITDEFYSSGSFPTRTVTDRRDQVPPDNGNTSDGTYVNLQQARRALKDAAEKVASNEDLGPDSEDYQLMRALEGFAILALAEGWCSAVPLSYVDEGGEFVYGSALSSGALVDTAIAKFDASLAGGSNSLAAIGKARALTYRGDYAAAAAAVAGVATEYVWHIPMSVSGTSNTIFSYQSNGRYSLSRNEGINGLPFALAGTQYDTLPSGDGVVVAEGDPRAPWSGPDPGFTPAIDMYMAAFHDSYIVDIPLATGIEARLIEAEAALDAQQYSQAYTILNDLRADADALITGLYGWTPPGTLDPMTTSTDPAVARADLFYERGFWLLLTGHRLGDLRRMVAQEGYGMPQNTVYPSGAYHKDGNYGTDVVFQMDFDESNNENYDLNQCDVSNANLN